MKILVLGAVSMDRKKLIEEVQNKLQQGDNDIIFIQGEDTQGYITNEKMKKAGIDFLLTFDMYGFEHSTLVDNIAYNLLDCKQIHILSGNKQINESCLKKPLSIAMFFYCTDFEYYQYLLEEYPDIPYLEIINSWHDEYTEENVEENAETLCGILHKVMDICHIGR